MRYSLNPQIETRKKVKFISPPKVANYFMATLLIRQAHGVPEYMGYTLKLE